MLDFLSRFKKKEIVSTLDPYRADKEELLEVTEKVLRHLYKTLSKSYGSLGENTVIFQSQGSVPIVTKDGLNILKNVHFPDDFDRFGGKLSRDIYQMIVSISASLVNKVGDGSTSAVITAANAFPKLSALLEEFDSKELTEMLELVQQLVETILSEFLSKQLPPHPESRKEILKLVAGISNDNDFDIGSGVADIMSHLSADSVIKILESPSDNSPLIAHTLTNGFAADDYRVVHGAYFTGDNKNGFDVKNPLVFMSYEFLDAHYKFLLEKVLPSLDKPLPIVIIADTIQIEVQTQIIKDAYIAIASKQTPQFILMTVNGLNATSSITKFMDLAVYLNCDPALATELPESLTPGQVLGHATKVSILPSGKNNFESGAGQRTHTTEYNTLVENIITELGNTGSDLRIQRGELRNRLNRLNGVNATIYVGGRTAEEKSNLKFLVEDSVLACQSVIRNGYTVGSNAAPLYALEILQYILCEDDLSVLYTTPSALCQQVNAATYKFSRHSISAVVDALIEAYSDTVDLPVSMYGLSSSIEPLAVDELTVVPMLCDSTSTSFNVILNVLNTRNGMVENFYIDKSEEEHVSESTSVIAPTRTDIEILRAMCSILSLILTSNQYLV